VTAISAQAQSCRSPEIMDDSIYMWRYTMDSNPLRQTRV
jgi:hypothetical protein